MIEKAFPDVINHHQEDREAAHCIDGYEALSGRRCPEWIERHCIRSTLCNLRRTHPNRITLLPCCGLSQLQTIGLSARSYASVITLQMQQNE